MESPKGPNVGHCKSCHLVLESCGDYMCDELVKRSLATIKCLGVTVDLIVVMEVEINPPVNGSETFD